MRSGPRTRRGRGEVGDGQGDEPQPGGLGEAGLVGEPEFGALGVGEGADDDVGADAAQGRHVGGQEPVTAGPDHGA
ncbi:hypothetical protein ACFU8Q_20355 [Streptomyces sp. NPDC057543]|uniref:hypothetical protein n=1 Tax=Streptomyces sp. NPDC057543 TaxID=3346163 RepID=UPI003687F80A